MSETLSLEEMQSDLAATERDCSRLSGIVTNLELFIRDAQGEDRRFLRTDLMKYESMLRGAKGLRATIKERIAGSGGP